MIAHQKISVLERIIETCTPRMGGELARTLLAWQFTDEDNQQMERLSAKARSVGLTPEETEAFREFCTVGDFLSLLHLRAREALAKPTSSGA